MSIDAWKIGHIGITGRAQAGKDTAAAILAPLGWRRRSFADGVRSMAYAVDPMVRIERPDGTSTMRLAAVVDALGWDEAKHHPDVRRFLQRLGTEGVRQHLGDSTWIDLSMSGAEVPSVWSDVRFPNEAEAIRQRGGQIVRVTRRDLDEVPAHDSETAMDDYHVDAVVCNDGTLASLETALLRAVTASRV